MNGPTDYTSFSNALNTLRETRANRAAQIKKIYRPLRDAGVKAGPARDFVRSNFISSPPARINAGQLRAEAEAEIEFTRQPIPDFGYCGPDDAFGEDQEWARWNAIFLLAARAQLLKERS